MTLLPSSITQLHYNDNAHEEIHHYDMKARVPRELPQLTGLLHLALSTVAIPSTVLRGFSRLQKLHLDRCTLLPTDSEGAGGLGDIGGFAQVDSKGTAALLDALQQLTCLQHLQLNLDRLDTGTTPPHVFAALTASSHLTGLFLEPKTRIPLPKGAIQHMFGAGKQLPLLRQLAIANHDDSSYFNGWPDDQWTIDGQDLYVIASACPALQLLDITLSVKPDAELDGLLQLPQSCTSLIVGGAAFDYYAAGVVARLTQLRDLRWSKSPGFTGKSGTFTRTPGILGE
jgi:hypothetical protein